MVFLTSIYNCLIQFTVFESVRFNAFAVPCVPVH